MMVQILAGVPGISFPLSIVMNIFHLVLPEWTPLSLTKYVIDIHIILTWPVHFQFASYGPASIYGSCYCLWCNKLRQKLINLHVLQDLTA